MKLYDENNEMNAGNETEQNNIPAAPTEPVQNGNAQEDNTLHTDNTNTSAPAEEAPVIKEAPAFPEAPTAEPMHTQMRSEPQPNPQPQQSGTYSYSRESIPENTYRAAPQQNPYYNPQQQNQSQNQNSYNSPYGQQNTAGQQNPQTYGRPAGGYNPYGQQPNVGQNPYQQQPQNQNPYNPYGQQSQNPYQQNAGYNPVQQGDRISYEPNKKAVKKKRSGNGKKAAIAVACCCGLLFSTGFGFLGAVIANRVFPAAAPQEEIVVDTDGNVVSEAGSTAVFYKSVENLATSTTGNGGDLTMAQVSSLVEDTVVEITTEFLNKSAWFQYVSTGAGSGVILSQDGYIITNNHVICGSDGITPADTIKVRLTNGEEYDAELIGTDSDSDIAILKIEAKGLTPAIAGNSDNLVVGETVLAVGNPLGELGGTQTDGIISALDREIDVNGVTMTLLQTSAAVNPGNSGGALFNMRGELIGVVNAKSSGTGIEGLGFAIPVNDALNVAEQLMEYGYVRGKVTIGVSFYDIQDALEARYYGLPGYGLYVTALTEGMNDKALQVKDRIISIDGKEIGSFNDVSAIVKSHKVGDVLKFQVSRNGELMEVEVTCFEKVPAGVGEVEFQEK